MSIEAIFLGAQPGTCPGCSGRSASSVCRFVLVGLANHVGPDKIAVFPSNRHVRPLYRPVRADRADLPGAVGCVGAQRSVPSCGCQRLGRDCR